MTKETYLHPGTFVETDPRRKPGIRSLEAMVRETLAKCGYPCVSCEPTCAQPNLCDTLEFYGCDTGGGGPAYTFTNGTTLTELDVEWGGTLEHHTSILGGSQFNTAFTNLQQFSVTTARTVADSIVEMTLGSNTVTGAIITHRNTGSQQATINLNHSGTSIFGQNNGFLANAEVQVYGTQALNPAVDLIVGAGGPLKTFRVSTDGYFMFNPDARTDQTQVFYWDTVTSEMVVGPLYSLFYEIDADESMLLNLGATVAEFGFEDAAGPDVKLSIEKVVAPTTATVIKLIGVPSYANDVAAAAALPSNSVWKDPSNFLKIVP